MTSLPLDAESLRCFLAVAELLNFRRAAAKVGLSPPAFSDRIKRLEDDLGVELLVRTTRSVRLTEAGDRMVPPARAALRALEDCRSAAHEGAPQPYELTLGTRFELGLSWLVPALDALREQTPERQLHLRFGDSPELHALVHRGDIDACISSTRLSGAALEHARLHEEDYAFVGHAALLKEKPIKRAEDAGAHTLIDAHRDLPLFRYFVDASSREEAWHFQAVERLGAIAAIRERVAQQRGVAVLPVYLIRKDLDDKTFVRILPKRKLATDFFRLLWRPQHPRSEALHALAEQLRARPLS